MITSVSSKKPVKRNALKSRSTLDAIHNAHVQQFINNDDEISEFDIKIKGVASQLATCMDNERSLLRKEKERLEAQRSRLIKKDDLMDYYLTTGGLVFDYYDIQDKISAGAAISVSNAVTSSKLRPGSIFAELEAAAAADAVIATASSAGTVAVAQAQAQAQTQALESFDREKLLDKYLQIVDPEMAKNVTNEIDENWSECPNCNKDMIFSMNEAYISCSACGYQDFVLIDSDKPSYKDPPREISYYAYKRINHFNEWLAQFQAKESTEIPQEIFDGILIELRKERITNMASLKLSKLREILRKLKYNKYYEHIPHILNRLNGQNAPVMSRDNEEKLRHMFKEIQPSFQKHCPSDRSNFLSYSYVLYKFCELLELDEFLPCFPLLKNRDKLYMQDKIWQKICEDQRWEFIRTI
jgi:hypothetical protein